MGYPIFMQPSIPDIPKKRGRPSTGGRQKGIMLRLDPANLSALDDWISAQPEPRPTRPEAIRRLLAEALGKTAAKAKEPALPPPSAEFLRAAKLSDTKLLFSAHKRRP